MLKVALVLIGVVGVLSLGACGSQSRPQASPVAFSPLPSASVLSGAKLVVVNQAWRIGGSLLAKGKGFETKGRTEAWLLQGGRTYDLGAASVKADGSFEGSWLLPKTLGAGGAELDVCNYAPNSQVATGCLMVRISLRN